jgi:hypothetical protein
MKPMPPVTLAAALALALCALLAACGQSPARQTADEPDMPPMVADQETRISNPDESLSTLRARYADDRLAALLVSAAAISAPDESRLSFLIGARATQAALAAILGKVEAYRDYARVIGDAARELNLKSDRLEACVAACMRDNGIADPAERQLRMRADLNRMVDSLAEVLGSVGSSEQAVMLQLGFWAESVRLAAALVLADYQPEAAAVLGRSVEARSFASMLSGLPQPMAPVESMVRELEKAIGAMQGRGDSGDIDAAGAVAIAGAMAGLMTAAGGKE